jgi:hypothetical protein
MNSGWFSRKSENRGEWCPAFNNNGSVYLMDLFVDTKEECDELIKDVIIPTAKALDDELSNEG